MDTLILAFIAGELLIEARYIDLDTSLFEGQILDSMNLSQLIGFLENQFSIRIAPTDIAVENLDSVRRMLQFVARKKNQNLEGV